MLRHTQTACMRRPAFGLKHLLDDRAVRPKDHVGNQRRRPYIHAQAAHGGRRRRLQGTAAR